jgi:hypothetical protein
LYVFKKHLHLQMTYRGSLWKLPLSKMLLIIPFSMNNTLAACKSRNKHVQLKITGLTEEIANNFPNVYIINKYCNNKTASSVSSLKKMSWKNNSICQILKVHWYIRIIVNNDQGKILDKSVWKHMYYGFKFHLYKKKIFSSSLNCFVIVWRVK